MPRHLRHLNKILARQITTHTHWGRGTRKPPSQNSSTQLITPSESSRFLESFTGGITKVSNKEQSAQEFVDKHFMTNCGFKGTCSNQPTNPYNRKYIFNYFDGFAKHNWKLAEFNIISYLSITNNIISIQGLLDLTSTEQDVHAIFTYVIKKDTENQTLKFQTFHQNLTTPDLTIEQDLYPEHNSDDINLNPMLETPFYITKTNASKNQDNQAGSSHLDRPA